MHRREAIAAIMLAAALPVSARTGRAGPGATTFTINRARIDAALRRMVADGRAAGVSALLWQHGTERYFGAAGYADREARRPMARDTLVQIYSMTKPVTGVALMQLWEQGRFGLDDPLEQYMPAFGAVPILAGKGADGKPILRAPKRPITIRDLMRHTAGLSYGMRDTAADADFHAIDPLSLSNSLTEAIDKLARVPLLFDPGSEWSYSAAVDVQARLVEQLAGAPFEQHVRRTILDPLAMRETGWTQPAARRARLAASYTKQAGKLVRVPDERNAALNFGPRRLTMGGAGLAATLDDYMRFARMLLGRGTLDGVRILAPSTVRLMATDQLDPRIVRRFFLPSKGSVGFGLDVAVRTARPHDARENRGAVGEFFWDGAESTLFWVDPANDLTAVFFAQVTPFDGALHHDIRAAVYGAGYLGPPGD
jgi:CubicO group peptidase (beta-lactamase class C family)